MKNAYKILATIIVLSAVGLAILFETNYLYVPLEPPEDVADLEITLERTGCFGTCPIYSVTVDGDGSVLYEGIRFVKLDGDYSYQIPEKNVTDLVELFYRSNYFSLKDRYDVPATDLPTVITSLRVGDEKKTVENYGNSGPTRL